MKIVLVVDVDGAGKAGETIDVSDDRGIRWIAKGIAATPEEKPVPKEKAGKPKK